MQKALHTNDTQTTPFIVTNNWQLSNTQNDSLVIMEHSGSDGLPVAVEYLDYSSLFPITASNCNVALEQQSNDLVLLRDGLNVQGFFYPNTDPVNLDGTYQRMVYSQIINMFYNTYYDPTKIWGLEDIDFETSQTKRFIADQFTLFEIPQIVFGENMTKNTVVMFDTTTDNNITITDDGNCNLFAGINLFSRQQEIGEYLNQFTSGSNNNCDIYSTISIPDPPVLCLTYNSVIPSILLIWNVNDWPVTNYVIQKSTNGISYPISFNLGENVYSYLDTSIMYGTTYWYRIYGVNLLGNSLFSNVVSIFVTS